MQCMMNCQPQNRKRRNKQFPVRRTDKIPLRAKTRTSIFSIESSASCGASFPVSRRKLPTENASSLCSVKGATPPCDACASIPCGLAVCKQHKMLFAASKFEKGQLCTGKHICNLKLTKCISRKIDNDTLLW